MYKYKAHPKLKASPSFILCQKEKKEKLHASGWFLPLHDIFILIYIASCRDPNELKRTATSISWYPDGTRKLAVSYSILEFQKSTSDTCMESYIWDIGGYYILWCYFFYPVQWNYLLHLLFDLQFEDFVMSPQVSAGFVKFHLVKLDVVELPFLLPAGTFIVYKSK